MATWHDGKPQELKDQIGCALKKITTRYLRKQVQRVGRLIHPATDGLDK